MINSNQILSILRISKDQLLPKVTYHIKKTIDRFLEINLMTMQNPQETSIFIRAILYHHDFFTILDDMYIAKFKFGP